MFFECANKGLWAVLSEQTFPWDVAELNRLSAKKVGGAGKKVSSLRRSGSSRCSLQQLRDSRFSASEASEVRPRLLYDEYMCVCVFYLLWVCVGPCVCIQPSVYTFGWGGVWRNVCAVGKKPFCPVLLLISILSSTSLPAPLVTAGVCCWHFWRPEDKKTSHLGAWEKLGVAVAVMFTFVTNAVSFRWMKRSCWGYLLGEILKQTLCGLFRSAGDNQAAVTSAQWLKCFHGSVKKKKKKRGAMTFKSRPLVISFP